MKKQKQIRASWDWVAPWSDETENVRALARDLQEYGIKAATLPSHYVGHRLLAVHPSDVRSAAAALVLRGEKYIANSFMETLRRKDK